MKYGIGVRYSGHGIRLLKLVRSDKGMKITGVAAGQPEEILAPFFESEDIGPENTAIAVGLGPGDFLSSYMIREDEMTDQDMETHLKWEVEHKILSDPEEYTFDYSISDKIGCVFASRNELVDRAKTLLGEQGFSGMRMLVDVESAALLNGCEGAGEVGTDTAMLISLESEGITSIVMESGALSAVETVTVDEKSMQEILTRLDISGMKEIGDDAVERMAGYITESFSRLTSYGDYKEKPIPQQIVLSGGGVYIGNGNLAEIISEKTGISAVISNPLKPLLTEVPEHQKELADLSAVFTTCFGLALRALED